MKEGALVERAPGLASIVLTSLPVAPTAITVSRIEGTHAGPIRNPAGAWLPTSVHDVPPS
ncbi:MAG TPA: hypothetical protein VHJ18_10565 [Streptosporangiaceae bacterium]|nr:hypothetical protein [Streptosporangiaceae bacterium]